MSTWTHIDLLWTLSHNTVLRCHVIYFFAPIITALATESFFRLALESLRHLPILMLSEHFLTSCHDDMLQAHLVFFLIPSQNEAFLQEALVPFIRELPFETEIWALGVFDATGISLFLGPFSRQSWERCVCTLTHGHTYL